MVCFHHKNPTGLHVLPDYEERIVFKINLITFKTLNGSGPRYLEDILKFYHQARTLWSSRDHLRLEEQNCNMKTYGQRAFSIAAPDYGTSSPLKFEHVLMLIFLNLRWKRFFLKGYMTFSFVIFVFVFVFACFFLSFLTCVR